MLINYNKVNRFSSTGEWGRDGNLLCSILTSEAFDCDPPAGKIPADALSRANKTLMLENQPPGLKPRTLYAERCRGFENPLPRTKSPGLAR